MNFSSMFRVTFILQRLLTVDLLRASNQAHGILGCENDARVISSQNWLAGKWPLAQTLP
jgi:hypothetical protein